MNDEERRRRSFAAQGFAALAVLVFAHGAHAATVTSHAAHVAPAIVQAPAK
jgi:hypothetical protein